MRVDRLESGQPCDSGPKARNAADMTRGRGAGAPGPGRAHAPLVDDLKDNLSPRDAWRDAAQAAELTERLSRAAVNASAHPDDDHRLPDDEVAYWSSRVAASSAAAAQTSLSTPIEDESEA